MRSKARVSILFAAALGLLPANRPRASFLLVGPEGVGKTTLCQVRPGLWRECVLCE